MKVLTIYFNEASVKQGEVFQLDLPEGLIVGDIWDDVKVVSGKASLCDTARPGRSHGVVEMTFKAEEVGEIVIAAKSKIGMTADFKVTVN